MFYEDICVRFPSVWCCMFLESVPSMGPYESESALGVDSKSNASTYFTKGVCGFVDLDVDVVILEETKC